MLRIDFYAQHLTKHRANGVDLISDEPVCFYFDAGPRRSSTPITHQQVKQLVEELLPARVLEVFRHSGQCVVEHLGPDGRRLSVTISADHAARWKVSLVPAERAKAQQASTRREADAGQEGMRREERTGLSHGASSATVPSSQHAPQTSSSASASTATASSAAMASPDAAKRDGHGAAEQTARKPAGSHPKGHAHQAEAVEGEATEIIDRGKHGAQPVEGEPRINPMLRQLVELDGSDLHLTSTVVPMLRLHGDMKPLPRHEVLSPDHLHALLFEIMPERNRTEYEEKNDTDFAHTIEGVARFRANVFRDRFGIGAVFRQIPFEILSPEVLGLPKQVLDLCWLSKGLVVVTGPTGSGKSTTLATLVDYINRHRSDHIITIEDPIEFVHGNKKCLVNQREVGTHTKSFKNALRAALREDPDIVLVGEMRDLETISIAIETAETGHLVFGTLHTTTAPSTVDRVIDQFPPSQQAQIRVMLAESLRGVIAQVLCKKKGGGRVAAYEILIANSAVSNLIREGKTYQLTSVMQTGRKIGMQTMNDHLVQHVVEGRVSPEEAYIKCNNKLQMKELLAYHNIELNMEAMGEG